MGFGKYILDDHGEPLLLGDTLEDLHRWGRWFEEATNRVVKQDYFDHPFPPTDDQIGLDCNTTFGPRRDLEKAVTQRDLRIMVSTIFLGLDHNFTLHGPPVLWETMVFGGSLSGEQERYTSRAEALEGHEEMCLRVKADIALALAAQELKHEED